MPYFDLSVRAGARVSAGELERLGYACAGVTVECESNAKPREDSQVPELPQTLSEKSGKAAKKAKQYAAALANSLTLTDDGVLTRTTAKQLRQLKRITVKCEDMNAAQLIIASPVIKSYDIVAVEAQNAKVFQFLCEQGGSAIDILTWDIANRIPFQIKKPWIDAAITRGVYFEITYSACLGDSAGRRYFFSNATNIVRITNGRNLVLSSGSSRDLFLRSPYDVVNLGILVGLTYGQAMDALTNAPLAVIEHAKTRREVADVGFIVPKTEAMEH